MTTLSLCAEKARERAREEMREKISSLFDPAAVSAGGRGPRWWVRTWWSRSAGGGRACKGLAPSPFLLFGCLSHSFLKVLKNESVDMGLVCLGGLTFFPQRQVLNFLAYVTSTGFMSQHPASAGFHAVFHTALSR